MKKIAFVFGIFVWVCVFGCALWESSHAIEIRNGTNDKIFILGCNMRSDVKFPLEIQSNKNEAMSVRGSNPEIEFRVRYKNEEYSLRSGYIKDSSNFSIMLKIEDSELVGIVKTKTKEFKVSLEKI